MSLPYSEAPEGCARIFFLSDIYVWWLYTGRHYGVISLWTWCFPVRSARGQNGTHQVARAAHVLLIMLICANDKSSATWLAGEASPPVKYLYCTTFVLPVPFHPYIHYVQANVREARQQPALNTAFSHTISPYNNCFIFFLAGLWRGLAVFTAVDSITNYED